MNHHFEPTADRLIPELTIREEMVLLARTLWQEGYNDHLAGHITVNMHDGTLLCNSFHNSIHGLHSNVPSCMLTVMCPARWSL